MQGFLGTSLLSGFVPCSVTEEGYPEQGAQGGTAWVVGHLFPVCNPPGPLSMRNLTYLSEPKFG